MTNNRNSLSIKSTATLALCVSVAVISFLVTGCRNRTLTEHTELNSIEDTLAYTMGSMQKISYNMFIKSECEVDSVYRAACFKGIEKGYKDNDYTIAYYDGIGIARQLMKLFIRRDKSFDNKYFIDGVVDGSCDNKKDTLFDSVSDSVFYYKGLENSSLLKSYVSHKKYEGKEYDDFYKGFIEGAGSIGIPEKYAYVCGLVFGGSRLKSSFNSLNKQIYGSDTAKVLPSDIFFAGFKECSDSDAVIPHTEVRDVYYQADMQIKKLMYSENKMEGERFLKENSKKPGVITLSDGLQYKIIRKGNGRLPKEDSKVEVLYRGRTIDGHVFEDYNDPQKPLNLTLSAILKGMSEALQMMPEGSLWEVYIPQELAYGNFQTKDFKPFSTLIFEIELIKIK